MRTENEPRVVQRAEAAPVVPDEPHYRRGEQARRWGALLLVVGVVWLVFALAARGSLAPFGFAERSQPIPPQSFRAERVVISGVGDRVELVSSRGDEVRVEGEKHGFGWSGGAATESLERLQVIVTEQGDTLAIEVRRPSFSGIGRSPYAELRVALPAGVAAEATLVSGDVRAEAVQGDLRLTTVSGAVDAQDTAGSLTVRTTSGDVQLAEHRGALDVETTSGDIAAGGALERTHVSTISGDVRLDGTSGPVEARSISGDLSVREARDSSLKVESTSGDVAFEGALADGAPSAISNISGDVELRLSRPNDLRLDLSTLSGDLRADLPLRDVAQDRRSLRGSLGAGATAVSVSTTSGDITVSGE
jgi:hypothetical protein